jgi:hypothetical protein
MSFSSIFKVFSSTILKALNLAFARGLTKQLIEQAKELAKEAAAKFVDNAQRREWVVAQLVARGIPESIARLAVELAVSILKGEQK